MTRKRTRRPKKRLFLAVLPLIAITGLLCWAALQALGAGDALALVEFDSDSWAARCTAYTAQNRSRQLSDGTITLTCGSFTGADELWSVPETAGEISIDYTMTVGQGRAGLVLVGPDGAVTRLDGRQPHSFTPGPGGMTRLRLIGDGGQDIKASITIRGGGAWVVG